MGCGTSQIDPNVGMTGDEKAMLKQKFDIDNNDQSAENQNGNIPNGNAQNGQLPRGGSANSKKLSKKNQKNSSEPLQPAPKAVAFEVSLGVEGTYDSIIGKHPPKRLKHLEPLTNAPKLTAKELEEKLKLAEEKRRKKLENKMNKAKRSSRLRKDLLEAKEFEKTQSAMKEVEEKQRLAEQNREQKQRELEEKKRIREERQRKAKERAAEMKKKEGAEDVNFEVEKDENFNKDDDVDSWLDGDNNNGQTLGDRVYSGRESPHKQISARGSGDVHKRLITSASTTDSFDFAYQRNPAVKIEANSKEPDDFFDS